MKGTFNQGWWNCFEHFAAELLDVYPYETDICLSVLSGAGISKKEAEYWLNHTDSPYQRVIDVVRHYYLFIIKEVK